MTSNPPTPLAALMPQPSLPATARLPLNRCNLPPVILGSLTFQQHPVPLEIDGVPTFHAKLFSALDLLATHGERAQLFTDYMTAHFCLEALEEAGLTPGRRKKKRANANYLRLVRGWSFDSDGREGAVLKHWVETRFGLLARHHGGCLYEPDSEAYHRYLAEGAKGLYATNALEAQLDLLYTYCQYELFRQHKDEAHLTLYRGINRFDEHEVLERRRGGRYRVLLNNLNSFTTDRERADEFGDYILEAAIPLPKIFFYNRLLPGLLKGEDEFVVIGGVYEVGISTF
ncbi:Dinitrogenase reductase ADP-ribosyltransferase (DRAT) [Thioflavicoccus mobilis 8321]|uniref:Dinitrogenase reductase ADP-ribosyltransferase (DRAT) n=1 Tax=Thioflavicoccus mobilis 8321 TaxID=765912 RepID=L0H2V3_9GAMM|nr:NAD(+)--dinitrogen-reductase ADP-D-ribosyltransferase [Thioflavicoccus mobilis]AGA91924.1 Dinitrogenase reductase ADP-ribosyltransferase (DRAT) [Thioflavicoccus mobilis 8321]